MTERTHAGLLLWILPQGASRIAFKTSGGFASPARVRRAQAACAVARASSRCPQIRRVRSQIAFRCGHQLLYGHAVVSWTRRRATQWPGRAGWTVQPRPGPTSAPLWSGERLRTPRLRAFPERPLFHLAAYPAGVAT